MGLPEVAAVARFNELDRVVNTKSSLLGCCLKYSPFLLPTLKNDGEIGADGLILIVDEDELRLTTAIVGCSITPSSTTLNRV